MIMVQSVNIRCHYSYAWNCDVQFTHYEFEPWTCYFNDCNFIEFGRDERKRVNKQKTIKRLKIGIELKAKQSNLDKSLAKLKVIDKTVLFFILFFSFCFFHLFEVKNFSLEMGKLKMLCQQKLRSILLRWHIIRFKQWRK